MNPLDREFPQVRQVVAVAFFSQRAISAMSRLSWMSVCMVCLARPAIA